MQTLIHTNINSKTTTTTVFMVTLQINLC